MFNAHGAESAGGLTADGNGAERDRGYGREEERKYHRQNHGGGGAHRRGELHGADSAQEVGVEAIEVPGAVSE